MVLLGSSCTSVYKQAPKQTFLVVCVYGVVLLLASFVLRCTNRHQNKPISSCLCLWVGAFSRILYFDVQPGTKTNLFLVVCLWDGAFSRILYFDVQTCTETNLF